MGRGFANFDNSASVGWVEAVRGPVDQLFFSVMYAVILYIMAMSSFKLIDLIPNQMMRWLGTAVSTFGDNADGAGQLMSTAQGVTGNATSTAIGGMQKGIAGVKSGVKGVASIGQGDGG